VLLLSGCSFVVLIELLTFISKVLCLQTAIADYH
jgi:hypothetical protein